MSIDYENKIIVCDALPYNGRYYLVKNRQRRWITTPEAALFFNIDISGVTSVDAQTTASYTIGPKIVAYPEKIKYCKDHFQARAFLCKDFKGSGIEFGAATCPTPTPLDTTVTFADFFDSDEGCNADYADPCEEFVTISYKTSLDEMSGIADNSVDFIINCHVIEHVRNPLTAIQRCYEKLKDGGVLLMAVPHIRYTSDHKRELTSLDHFVADYQNPCIERDVLHFIDICEHIEKMYHFVDNKQLYAAIEKILKDQKFPDMHFHTFAEENFGQLTAYFNRNIYKWSKTEIIDRILFKGSYEFYVRLTK